MKAIVYHVACGTCGHPMRLVRKEYTIGSPFGPVDPDDSLFSCGYSACLEFGKPYLPLRIHLEPYIRAEEIDKRPTLEFLELSKRAKK